MLRMGRALRMGVVAGAVDAQATIDTDAYFLGIDFGTSGARACVINDDGEVVQAVAVAYSGSDGDLASSWRRALFALLEQLPAGVKPRIRRIAIDGTSSTALLVDDASGAVLQPAKLYNEAQSAEAVAAAQAVAPSGHTVCAATSTLCKLLAWHLQGAWQDATRAGASPRLLHQADWLLSLLTGVTDTTDWNNCLKLGFDTHTLAYPPWLQDQPWSHLLPSKVLPPGAAVAPVTTEIAELTGLPQGCVVCAGTTDSIAAFLAAGAAEPGDAVTSLGSTMAIKLLSDSPVDDARYGIYSHRLEIGWLVGGASNTGGAVLRQLFTDSELSHLSSQMDSDTPTALDYYPLPCKGERFPVYDPDLEPRLVPRPDSDAVFLQGVFEGIARIEGRAYDLMQELGASKVRRVFTAGGGAANATWTAIRCRTLRLPVQPSPQGEASYGAALLAKAKFRVKSDGLERP